MGALFVSLIHTNPKQNTSTQPTTPKPNDIKIQH